MREAVAIDGLSKHNLSNTLEQIYCPISTRVLAPLLSETTGNSSARQRAFNLAAHTAGTIRSFRPRLRMHAGPSNGRVSARRDW